MTLCYTSIVRDRTGSGSDAAPFPYRSVPVNS